VGNFLSRVTDEPSWMTHLSEITLRIC